MSNNDRTMGLCAVAAASASAQEVSLSGRHPHQEAAGNLLGATSLSGKYDLVVDGAGTTSSLALAAELARPGGTIFALAKCDIATLPISPTTMMHKELRLVSPVAFCGSSEGRDIDVAPRLVAGRPELPGVLITHRFSVNHGLEAFATAENRASGSIKVVIHLRALLCRVGTAGAGR